MLKKLLKYDFVWINKFMLIYFTITLVVSLLTRFMRFFNTSFVGNIIYLILRGITISAFASTLINCIIRIWVRFRNNFYKDESYLTHTLPITKNTLYDAKIVSLITSLLLSVLVLIICFVIAFLNKDVIDYFKEMLKNSNMIFIIVCTFLIAILELLYMAFSGIVGTLVGYRSNNSKVLKSVLYGIGIYFFIQIIILLIIYALGLFNQDLNSLFTSSAVTLDLAPVKALMIITMIIYVLFITIMYFIGKKIFNKGVNVD